MKLEDSELQQAMIAMVFIENDQFKALALTNYLTSGLKGSHIRGLKLNDNFTD